MDDTKIEELLNDWKSQFDAARTDRPGGLTQAQVRFFLRFLEYIEGHLAPGERMRLLTKRTEVQHERLRRRRRNGDVVERRDDRQEEIPFPNDEDYRG